MTGDDVQRALGRIEGKLDEALPLLHGHETRISRLERWRAGLAAIGALLTAVVTYLVGSRG